MDECTFTSAELSADESVISLLDLEEWKCSRPVWKEHDEASGQCVWHADATDKPLVELNSTTEGGDLHGALVPSGAYLEELSFPEEIEFVAADLSGVRLNGVDFSEAVLLQADLSKADLSNADLQEIDLLDADLSGAYLDDADLSGARLNNADLSEISLRRADLSVAELPRVDLSDADLLGADLSGADFRGADLQDARLNSANLQEARLSNVDLSDVDLTNADLSGARLEAADFSGAELTSADLQEARLTGADLSRAGLLSANLRKAQLTDVDFSEANLQNANLSEATIERGLFSRANLFNTCLAGAGLEGAVFGNVQLNERTFNRLASEQTLPVGTLGGLGSLKRLLLGPTGKDSLRCAYDPDSQYDLPGDDETGVPEVRAAGVYREFERLARENALPEWQQEFFHLRQDMQTRQKTGAKYLFAVLQRVLFGYGERFGRVVGWSGVIIVLFACINLLGGWIYPVTADGELGNPLVWTRLPEAPGVVWESLYYSTLTFTALGFGDYRPVSAVGQLATIAETAVGAVLLALLVFVLGRRAAR